MPTEAKELLSVALPFIPVPVYIVPVPSASEGVEPPEFCTQEVSVLFVELRLLLQDVKSMRAATTIAGLINFTFRVLST